MKKILLASFLLPTVAASAQNMIVNPGAESALVAPWVIVSSPNNPTCSGTSGWRVKNNPFSSFPRTGTYLFYPGCNSSTGGTYEIQQSVPLTDYAASIDQGTGTFTFAGWYSGWNQTNPDQVSFQLEFFNAANTFLNGQSFAFTTTATNNSGTQSPWARAVMTLTAPVNSRSVTVRVLARHNSGSAIDSYVDDLSMTPGPSPLPITLGALRAVSSTAGVVLNWDDYKPAEQVAYTVQWSTDGMFWTGVGTVQPVADGRSGYTHAQAALGNNYYRIAAMGRDNVVTYSNTVTVSRSGSEPQAALYPNPASGSAHLTWNGAPAEAHLLNIQGMHLQTIQLAPGVNTIDISALAPGTYIFKAGADTQRLIVR